MPIQVAVRLERELIEAIETSAKKNGRSRNSEISTAIEHYLHSEEIANVHRSMLALSSSQKQKFVLPNRRSHPSDLAIQQPDPDKHPYNCRCWMCK